MADKTLKRSPFQTETEDEQEKEELKRSPFATETIPTLPTTSGFLERLGLVRDTGLLPEQPLPKRELATSPVIEEMKAKVEAEVEQGGIWKLRDEADEVSKQFQVLEAEQAEAEAMKLPTGAMRDKRSLLLDVWNKKNAELQARRAAFEEKTGFTPDEYGRSEKEIKLLRRQEIDRKLDRIEEEIDAGTTGPPSWEQEESWRTRKFLFLGGEHTGKDIFTRARDTDTASLLFGPSKRTEGDWRPLAKSSREGILPWKKGLDEAFWEDWNSQPKDRNKGMKVLDGVVAAVFEGLPKTPWHDVAQDGMVGADESSARVDKKYGKDSWQAQYWGATMGVTKTLLGFSDVMFGNVGGLATLGAGGALAKTAQAARGTAAGTAAAATAATGEAALAVHIAGQIQLSLPSVLDTMYDPKASIKEKSEALSGTVLAAFFVVKLGKNSAKTLEGALKSQYGIDINLETATRAELNNAGVRIVRVRENKAAKAEGREPITPKEGETLMEYATRVAAEKVKVVEGKILPKLKGEKQKTYNRMVGELQALERMRLDEPRIDKETGKEVREGIPVEETTIVEPILSERPVRPEVPVEEAPAIVIPPEPIPEAGSLDAYYGKEKPTLQVLKDPTTREAKLPEELEIREPIVEEVTPEVMEMVERLRETRGRELKKPTPEEVIREEVAAEEKVDASTLEAKTDVADALIKLHEEMGVAPPDKAILDALREEPAKPAAKAAAEVVVEDAKVEEAAKEVVEAEAKLVAEAGESTVEVKKRMKKLVEREIAFLRREGATTEDIATARELELDNTSFYDILPTSRWADTISKLSKGDVEAMKATEGFPANLKSMTDSRIATLNYEAWKAAEKGSDAKLTEVLKEEYTKSLQEWTSDQTVYGQLVESNKHYRHTTPAIQADLINQALKDSVGGKEIVGKERTELEGLIEKSMDAIKEFTEAQDKFSKKPTEENFNAAFEQLQKSEAASREQWEFMTNHSPKLWADLYVSALQGNLLTPATLVLNVAGNIVPLLLRAPSRATARALDLMHEFYTGKPARRAELRKLREEFEAMADKESPEYADAVAEIARREKEIISDTIIQPARGALAKFKGLTKGMGLERIREALKAPEGERWQAFKHRRYDDAISSLLFGQRTNMYEAGAPELAMSPLSPWRAWKRIGRQISSKEGKQGAEKTLKDLAEGTLGVAPNLMFRALAAGDLPFRHAEFARLVENYGTRLGRSKGWGRDKTDIWIERATKAPEIVFGEKQLLELRNEANRATFQDDNWATDLMGRLNVGLRAPKTGGLKGAALRTAYMGYRSTVPFQKTLVNIFAENLSFTPLGFFDAALNPRYSIAQRKLATGRALTGTAAYIGINWLRDMTGNDIFAVDYSMGMEDEKRSVAYLSGEVIPDGTVNWGAWGRFLKGEDTTPQKGDKVTNLKKFGPVGDMMLAVASFQDTLEKMPASKREEFGESLTNLMVGVGGQKFRFLLNQSFAQNARDFVQGMLRGKPLHETLKPWARGVAAVAIPNTLDWFYNNSKDNPWRRNYRSDTFTDELKLSWKKKMIAWDWITSKGEWSEKAGEQNPVIFNLWGEPVERIRRGGMLLGIKKVNPDSSFERYLHSSLGVVETGQIIPTAESSEIWRLWRDTRNSSIAPSIPMRKISRDKVNYELNRDQYAVYQRLIGLRRMKGPPPGERAVLSGGSREYIDEGWSGMANLLLYGDYYQIRKNQGKVTKWEDMKQDEQVKHVLKMYSGASRSAGDYLVDNFMLKKPTKENLIALAGLGEDATEKEARAVIKGFSINLDNLDKLEVTEKPSGRLKK